MKENLSVLLPTLLFFNLTAKAQKNFKLSFGDLFVLKIQNSKLIWIDNHNHFDIYQATPDNMYVVKPDSTKHFNMPIAGKFKITKTPIKPPEKSH